MADDFTMRLISAHGQLIDCLKWSINNKQLDCAANLQPIMQAFAGMLTDMINKQDENITRRGKMKLVKNSASGGAVTGGLWKKDAKDIRS